MTTKLPHLSLRSLLLLDAATCAAAGLALPLGAEAVAGLTALPVGLLRYAGLSLLPVAAFMALVALRPELQRTGTRLVILGNAAWAVASLALLLSGWVAPNGLGIALVAGQALAVAALAVLEHAALRHGAPRPQTA
ncbi:MAG: hypothetical protein ACFCUT_06135 [Kiloniellaceae bacterium]